MKHLHCLFLSALLVFAFSCENYFNDNSGDNKDEQGKCAIPVFSPAGGTFSLEQSVTITCETDGAEIRYTTDGTDPSETIGAVIPGGGSFTLGTNATIKAIAYKSGVLASDIVSADYIFQYAPREISLEIAGAQYQSGDSLSFGDIPFVETVQKTVLIRNDGGFPLTITGVSLTGTNADQFSLSEPGMTAIIKGGQSRSFTVTFSPSVSGANTAQMKIDNDDTDENPFMINLSGTAKKYIEVTVLNGSSAAQAGAQVNLDGVSKGTTGSNGKLNIPEDNGGFMVTATYGTAGGLGLVILSGETVSITITMNGTVYNGHIYEISSYTDIWTNASAACLSMGVHLATLTDSAENAYISSFLTARGVAQCWLGGNDESTEGTWEWCNGEPFSWTNWAIGEPNNLGDEDGLMIFSGSGNWNDVSGANASYYLCECD